MFTGLVEEIGTVRALDGDADGVRMDITAHVVTGDLRIGDSVAVSGTCLTAVEVRADGFAVDMVAETLARTSLGDRLVGDGVNLERALRADARLGGHIVQGHVDDIGRVREVRPEGDGRRIRVDVPAPLRRYVVRKGSIAIDGVSLTVATTYESGLEVALIPHTLEVTTLGRLAEGDVVNLEVDLVAKYVEALAAPYRPEGDR